MIAHEGLRRLANLAGIEPHYWDIQGTYHETSPETARMLLCALGFAVEDDAAIMASLSALENKEWRTLLPPVTVCRENERVAIPLHMPTGVASGARLNWVIHMEDGTARTSEFLPDQGSPEIARHVDGYETHRYSLLLPSDLPAGYHALHLDGPDNEAVMPLIVAPPRCYLPSELADGQRLWGIAAQLYAIKSARNWGVGDFSDLGGLVDWAAERGAAAIGLNPLHALFSGAPENASPYSPNSRLFLNPIYLDVTAVPDFAESAEARALVTSPDFAEMHRAARVSSFVDYSTVTHLKMMVLEKLYDSFRRNHLNKEGDVRGAAFRHFQSDDGQRLLRFAMFEALSGKFGTNDWPRWPPAYHDPSSAEVISFACAHRDRIAFFQYLQWQTDMQFAAAQRRSMRGDMAIGLYGDLAVSVDRSGADHWAEQDIFAGQAQTGAPPDPFNALGQNWGVVPMNPWRLRETGYAHFIAVLRATMRHVGALRIDHVIELQRLFWIPAGLPASAGAYVTYPFEDLLAILALESHRNTCLVVGEDLGTVPEGFRERMAEANALSYRVLYFEKDGDRFKRPADYPAMAAACISTHDLATLKGFWAATDLGERARLGLFQSEQEQSGAYAERAHDRWALLQALAEECLLPGGADPDKPETVAMTPALVTAIHAFLARSTACLLMIELDDLTGEEHQVNLPGTMLEYPNWRRRLSRSLDDLIRDAGVRNLLAEVARERRLPSVMQPARREQDTQT